MIPRFVMEPDKASGAEPLTVCTVGIGQAQQIVGFASGASGISSTEAWLLMCYLLIAGLPYSGSVNTIKQNSHRKEQVSLLCGVDRV